MPDQNLSKLKPTGTVVKNLKTNAIKEPNPPGNDSKKARRLRKLVGPGGAWAAQDIGLIAWVETENRWVRWDRKKKLAWHKPEKAAECPKKLLDEGESNERGL